MNNSRSTLIMAEVAMMAALAVILDLLTFLRFWPQGGSVSLAMLPILVMAFRRGIRPGVATGLIFGIINMIYNPFIVHWLQALLDYPVAFAVIGLAGLFTIKGKASGPKVVISLILGVTAGVALRFLAHFTAGVVWFGEFAPEGTPVAVYAFTYNISYLLPSMIVCLIVLILLNIGSRRILQPA
ncbi:energy-coupled thiamine transporter ThiT [Salipaludibacillus aurantiacus]|uniref:Thiamine transporter n=1 Tax=Salipaludibacillus aurantiacus TaxID=1601833 RepID=A0A1H9QQD4_9BACI|nr:energy-coupled thiamine transporter ThiT [Salipaludibacillus aurantiacus]SER62445.1 thiamine transporter [Salipaludibacillus aurantiacus]